MNLNILLIIAPLLLLYIHAVRESVHTAGRLYLRHLVEGNVHEKRTLPTSGDQARTVLALRLGRVLVLVVWTYALWHFFASRSPLWQAILLVAFIVLVGDETARMVGQWVSIRSERMRTVLEKHARFIMLVMAPAVWIFWLLSRRGFGLEPVRDVMLAVNEDQIVIMARADAALPMERVEREFIANIFELRETVVREIMVPRLDIVAIPVETPLKEALDVIVEHGHSRIPVYEESIDNIQGILYAKDILREMREAYPHWPDTPIRNILREPYFVPDSKRVSELLTEMQAKKVHLAIVVDEYGGTAGLITIEDLIEEIVGEIQDEYDREMPEIEFIREGEYRANARVDVEELSDQIGVPLPEEEADTVGGLIYAHLKRMPREGDVVEFPGVRLQVEKMEGRRIRWVHIWVDHTTKERQDSNGRNGRS